MTKVTDEERSLAIVDLAIYWSQEVGERHCRGDLTATTVDMAEKLGWDSSDELRSVVLDALYALSDPVVGSLSLPNMEDDAAGVVELSCGDSIGWWHNGAETEWRDVESLSDEERQMVGLE